MQCAAERKYCAGVLGQLRGRAAAQLRGNIVCDPAVLLTPPDRHQKSFPSPRLSPQFTSSRELNHRLSRRARPHLQRVAMEVLPNVSGNLKQTLGTLVGTLLRSSVGNCKELWIALKFWKRQTLHAFLLVTFTIKFLLVL